MLIFTLFATLSLPLRLETALLDLGQRVDSQSKDLLDRSTLHLSSGRLHQHHHHCRLHHHLDDQGGAAGQGLDGEAEGCEQGLEQAGQGGGGDVCDQIFDGHHELD